MRTLGDSSYQGSSSGSQPSNSSRQKKQQATSGSFSLGQWTKPALAICKENSKCKRALTGPQKQQMNLRKQRSCRGIIARGARSGRPSSFGSSWLLKKSQECREGVSCHFIMMPAPAGWRLLHWSCDTVKWALAPAVSQAVARFDQRPPGWFCYLQSLVLRFVRPNFLHLPLLLLLLPVWCRQHTRLLTFSGVQLHPSLNGQSTKLSSRTSCRYIV